MLSKTSTEYPDDVYGLCDIVREAPGFVLADESIMMGLIKRDEKVLKIVSSTLWECPSFVQAVLYSQRHTLWYLPKDKQPHHVHLIADHFPFMDTSIYELLVRGAKSVNPFLWNEEKIASSWVRAGYPFVKNVHPEAMMNDRRLVLLMARHVNWTNWFSEVSAELRSDKQFVKDVMKVNAEFFLGLPKDLQKDFDLALTFVLNQPKSTVMKHIRESDDSWKDLLLEPLKQRIKRMQQELDGWNDFEAAYFERGVLNVGPEVTRALKRHVKAYVGYPYRSDLNEGLFALENAAQGYKSNH
jgi:hypothetical protein